MACPGWNKVTSVRTVYSRWEKSKCLGFDCPTGRQLDQFDADIIVDLSAHQTMLQVCRGEGDIIVHRLQVLLPTANILAAQHHFSLYVCMGRWLLISSD